MTKSELIARIAQRYPQLEQEDAEEAVKMILDAMAQSLADGHRIELRGFGSFVSICRPARIGRNPKTGEEVQIPAKRAAHFKAGRELRERVNGRKGETKGNAHAGPVEGEAIARERAGLRKVA